MLENIEGVDRDIETTAVKKCGSVSFEELSQKPVREDLPPQVQKNSFFYFENRGCFAFPCHASLFRGEGVHNCMFCYCPLYSADCSQYGGAPVFLKNHVKDCSSCELNHDPKNYQRFLLAIQKHYNFINSSSEEKSGS